MESCKTACAARAGWSVEEEALLFAEAERARGGGLPLKSVFETVASATGRKPNSIRNYYYARVKDGAAEGSSFHSAAFVPFTREEVRQLLRTVLSAQARGVSVRACTLSMGNGDTRSMLRYQNKYRSVVKNDPVFVREILAELEAEGLPAHDPYAAAKPTQSSTHFDRMDALAFFEALEALAAKYRRMVM